MVETIKNLENVLTGTDKVSEYIENTQYTLNEVGIKLVKVLFDVSEESIRQTEKRKKDWYIERGIKKKHISQYLEM